MIKQLLLLCTLFALLAPLPLVAQSTTPELDSLAIEIWPDYDQPSVLVLLTGIFPPGTAVPVTFTIPLPEDADVHAVAHITAQGTLTDQDIEYSISGDELTLTSPNPNFRVEFYMPYNAAGLEREFAYTWEGETAVNNITTVVQQPLAAASMSTTPGATTTSTGSNDLTYHNLPVQSLAAGESFTVSAAYTMNSDSLTADLLQSTAVTTQPSPTSNTAPANNTLNWPLLLAALGFVLIVFAVVWQVLVRPKSSSRPRKPQKVHTASGTEAKYCHHCGIKLQPNDKFCRECGTAVKK
jgi:hypothetical protein